MPTLPWTTPNTPPARVEAHLTWKASTGELPLRWKDVLPRFQ
ncbi:hypothetical protein [Streptomyces sp. NPDC102360]